MSTPEASSTRTTYGFPFSTAHINGVIPRELEVSYSSFIDKLANALGSKPLVKEKPKPKKKKPPQPPRAKENNGAKDAATASETKKGKGGATGAKDAAAASKTKKGKKGAK